MKNVFKLIQEKPKEFIEALRERFCKNKFYLSNKHWDDFDSTNHLSFHKKSDDGSIEADQIWFTFEDDLEGSTKMVMGMDIKKPDGIFKFKDYVFAYRLDEDWND